MIFLVDMPPPVHGMTNINLAIYKSAINDNAKICLINSVPSKFSQYHGSKLWSILKIAYFPFVLMKLIFALLTEKNNKTIYRSINGGSGQYYDYIYLKLAKLFSFKVIIHHHSFNYINIYRPIFKHILSLLSTSDIHIVLGTKMAVMLAQKYKIPTENFIILSNSAFYPKTSISMDDEKKIIKKIKIGHLANLSIEKGVDTFINICRKLEEKKIPFDASIAGPFFNRETKEFVLKACEANHNIKYVGPVYNKEKENFFKSLDIFIFPSKYKNEAEPLVNYEAAFYGSFVIGSQVGCMEECIEKLQGITFPLEQNESQFVNNVTNYISNIYSVGINQNKAERKKILNNLIDHNKKVLHDLIQELKNV